MNPNAREAAAKKLGFVPVTDIKGNQHAYQHPETKEWLRNETLDLIVSLMEASLELGYHSGDTFAQPEAKTK